MANTTTTTAITGAMTNNDESWISLYVCLLLSLALIFVRLFLRRWRQQTFTRGDYWCMVAGVLVLARLITNHYLLIYNSTRTIPNEQERYNLVHGPKEKLARLIIGSKLVLCTRSLLVCILWCAKMAVLDLLAILIMRMPFERRLLYSFWAVLFLTFLASIVTVFLSCRPVSLHWRIEPDPGNCVVGNVWIFTYEVSNIVTDTMLMAVSFSLILSVKIPLLAKIRVLCLFSVGILLIAISITRMIEGRNSRTQSGHTLWASIEVLFATVVAVTPTIYALSRNSREAIGYIYDNSHMSPEHPDGKASATELEDGFGQEDATSVSRIFVHAWNQDWGVRGPSKT